MSRQTSPDADRTRDDRSPWERFTWVMGAVWLAFLAFPVAAAVESDQHPAWRAVAVAAIVTFAAIYIYGFVSLSRHRSWAETGRFGRKVLACLSLLTALTVFVVGVQALGMVTFLLAFTMFSHARRVAYSMAAGWVVLTAAVLLLTDRMGDLWFFLVINVGVGLFTGLVRWIDDQQGRHERLSRELDVVAERERVARDVHDVLGHSLTVITVRSELAERLVDADPEAAKAELVQIRSVTREALAEIRATVAGLRVARLGDELDAARDALSGAGIEADVPESPDAVDPQHRLVLAWVLREAVTNVVRHSRGSHCRVRLGPASLEVIDDGVGLDGALESSGLRGVRERVAAAGGTLSLGPAVDGRGTQLEVRW
ncbi:sensor histidine kinase [Georgenia halophila]|uniref:Sensor histidine kinase n=1 Tax=Georgenia halophila TaxID=620889 RepID=A0ABP8KYI0_9MICO